MSQLALGTKIGLINLFAQAAVVFIKQNAPGSATNQSRLEPTAANAATATGVYITGFGEFGLSDLRYVRVVKPANGVKNKIVVDSADPTHISVAPNLPAGQVIVFKLVLETDDSRGEFASEDTRDKRYFPPLEYITRGNDTAAQVVEGLAKQLNNARDLFPEADGEGEPFVATFDAGVLTLEAIDNHLKIELTVNDLFQENKAQVPVFSPETDAEQFSGRGTYGIMKNIIEETEGSNAWHAHTQRTGLPNQSGLYQCYNFGTGTERDDLSNQGAAGASVFQKADFCLYVAANVDNDPVNDALITFFNRIPNGAKSFIKGDVDGTEGTAADLVAAPVLVAIPGIGGVGD